MKKIGTEHSEPLLALNDSDSVKIERIVGRVTAAQALGVVGLGEAAIEIALPEDVLPSDELLRSTEARRAKLARDLRNGRTVQQHGHIFCRVRRTGNG